MWLTAAWYERPATRTSLLLGLTAGLIVLVRHTNVLFLLVFVLYGAGTGTAVTTRARELWRHRAQLALVAAAGMLVLTPQLLIYYQATGHFLVSSYGEQAFYWSSPRVVEVLFGVRKGLFFWSPLLLLAAAGLALLMRSSRPAAAFVVAGVLFLAVNTYVIASWWDWQFGGSFGHRGYVDALPLFALGLAAAFEGAARQGAGTRHALAVVVVMLAALSVFQMLQYWYGILPFSDTTWSYYREVFLRWR